MVDPVATPDPVARVPIDVRETEWLRALPGAARFVFRGDAEARLAAGMGTLSARPPSVRERRRMTVDERRSSTRLACRSFSMARLIRSTSSTSRFDMWFFTSMPNARTLVTRSLLDMPRSLATS